MVAVELDALAALPWGRQGAQEGAIVVTAQLPLPFESRLLARTTDPQTSVAAARQAKTLCSEHHQLILQAMSPGHDYTAGELAIATGTLTTLQVDRRLHELHRGGLIEDSGNRRPTPSGRMARCFRLAGATR